jgi:hypothetical protein
MAGNRLAKLTQANKTAIFGFAETLDPTKRKRKNAKPQPMIATLTVQI